MPNLPSYVVVNDPQDKRVDVTPSELLPIEEYRKIRQKAMGSV
ncbi:MAG TPA: hypothetical protein VMW10_04650 [Alphaproteobacteria bacterium]|nr:hypothetical protein [Alphaproteobacteria bacterium]